MVSTTTQATVAAIAASLMASLAPVPAQSATLPVTAVDMSMRNGVSAHLTCSLPGGQIFLPLEEAADYLKQLNDRQRFLLNTIVQERKERGTGPLLDMANQIKRLCNEGINQHLRVKEAVLQVLKGDNIYKSFPDDLEQQAKYKANLLRFGRAVAQGEFILRDTLSLIEQSIAPTNAIDLVDMPSDEDVKAWIVAEHKSLNLAMPEFS